MSDGAGRVRWCGRGAGTLVVACLSCAVPVAASDTCCMGGDEMAGAMAAVRTAAVTVDARIPGTRLPFGKIAEELATSAGLRVVHITESPDLVIFVRAAGHLQPMYYPRPGQSPERSSGSNSTPGSTVRGEVWLNFATGGCYRMDFMASVPPAYRDGYGPQAAYKRALRELGGGLPVQGDVIGYVSLLVGLVARTHGAPALRAALTCDDAGVRAHAALQLGLMGDRESAALIASLLNDGNGFVRLYAIYALNVLGRHPKPPQWQPNREVIADGVGRAGRGQC